jgi:hypothetical protein
MPKDAKFGLVVGVGVVVLIAALFFRKDHERPVAQVATQAVSARPAADGPAPTTPPGGAGSTSPASSTNGPPADPNPPTVYSVASFTEP